MAVDTKAWQSMIDSAKNGNLSVKFNDSVSVNAEEFVYIERDCQAMKDEIQALQRIATGISKREVWGLGESSDWIKSAPILVARLRAKAQGAADGNDVHSILQQHYDVIDKIQELHRTIAQKYTEADSAFSSKYNELMASLPQGFQGQK
ncbi:hypothetical protein [Nocardia sp. NPDC050435]|uniref:hypothetical protein n=1 Tax=Nocardia sp. NPDC050435 TaxID=3155040 RepID=UPI003409D90D